LEENFALAKAGSSNEARMAMIAMTTKSSIRVKAVRRRNAPSLDKGMSALYGWKAQKKWAETPRWLSQV
jgi:hypothetical protein